MLPKRLRNPFNVLIVGQTEREGGNVNLLEFGGKEFSVPPEMLMRRRPPVAARPEPPPLLCLLRLHP